MSVSLRAAMQSDLPAILEIDGAAFSQPWSEKSFQDALDDKTRTVSLVAQSDDGTVCGFGFAWHVGEEGEIATLAVADSECGKGLGETIVRALLKELHARGATQIFLEVRPSNISAQRLYEKIGFVQIGLRKNYYANGESAIVMKVAL